MDVLIKDVPIGAEEKVKEMALMAIERFKRQSLVIPEIQIKAFETEIDNIRVANNLTKKYSVDKPIEPIEGREIVKE